MLKNSLINMLVSLLSLLLTLLLLETATRVLRSEYRFVNFLEERINMFRTASPAEFSPELGWRPSPGVYANNVWGATVTILEDTSRANSTSGAISRDEVILAVGDSFTFGDQVSDNESWPALLEQKSGARVINGGVFGYGVDQAYLRMEEFVAAEDPDVIIFSLIPDDIVRAQFSSRHSIPKPYFELSADNELLLRDDHIVETESEQQLGNLRRALGYSLFVHRIMKSLFPDLWINGTTEKSQVHSLGAEVTCGIFERLNEYAAAENIRVYVLLQYSTSDFIDLDDEVRAELQDVQNAASCVDSRTVSVIDLYAPLATLHEQDPDRFSDLFDGHMTPAGNDYVASIVWDRLRPQMVSAGPAAVR